MVWMIKPLTKSIYNEGSLAKYNFMYPLRSTRWTLYAQIVIGYSHHRPVVMRQRCANITSGGQILLHGRDLRQPILNVVGHLVVAAKVLVGATKLRIGHAATLIGWYYRQLGTVRIVYLDDALRQFDGRADAGYVDLFGGHVREVGDVFGEILVGRHGAGRKV
jgi:hypothetical protein